MELRLGFLGKGNFKLYVLAVFCGTGIKQTKGTQLMKQVYILKAWLPETTCMYAYHSCSSFNYKMHAVESILTVGANKFISLHTLRCSCTATILQNID